MTDFRVELISLSDLIDSADGSPVDEPIDLGWQTNLNDTGTATLVLANDDPALALIETPNTLAHFYVLGVLAFTALLESWEAVLVDQREEVEELTTWHGRGHSCLLDGILIYPSKGVGRLPIQEDRNFNYTDESYDDSWWSPATVVTTVGDAKVNWAGGTDVAVQWDAEFPDDTAGVLWASDGTTTDAGEGDCYFRQSITIGTGGIFTLYAGADNLGEIYIDGQLLLSPGQADDLRVGFTRLSRITLDFTAGTHLVAFTATNASGPSPNPAGIAWAIYETDVLGRDGSLIAHSDSSALIVEYASEPPGMTPGKALLVCLAEAADRAGSDPLNAANYLIPTFDQDVDSNGDDWPTFADMATKVGRSVLEFCRELSATYIDFQVRPGTLYLDAWIKGGRGTTVDVDLHHAANDLDETANLTQHNERGEA